MAQREDRHSRRVGVVLPARLVYGEDQISTQTENISFLGTYVQVQKEVPVGTPTSVTLDLPPAGAGGNVQCEGIVVRCEGLRPGTYGIGIFFKEFLGDGEAKLGKLIDELLAKQNEEAQRYFAERERIRKERMKKRLAEKRKKRRKRGRPPKKRRSKAKRKTP